MLHAALALSTLALLVPLTLALPSQSPFLAPSIPPLDRANFPNHTFLPLNDGSFVPPPAFGVGSAWFRKDARDAVLSALRVGYRHLDNAAVYGNEGSVGEAIRLSGIPREELYITSKFDHLDGKNVTTELHESLSKLGVSYLDLYLIHFPTIVDSPHAVWTAFESLVSSSLVRTIGVSNYDVPTLLSLLSFVSIPPAINQIRYHPYNTIEQAPVLELARKEGIVTAAYSALSPLTKIEWQGGPVDAVLREVGERHKWTEGQVILEWVKEKGILVVTTSGQEFRQKEQLNVFGPRWGKLSGEEVERLEKAGRRGERRE